jgi:hypothetical protein
MRHDSDDAPLGYPALSVPTFCRRLRADMLLALGLLWDGVDGSGARRPSRARPEPGSPQEREARAALARLLYAAAGGDRHADAFIRSNYRAFARLLDPEDTTSGPAETQELRLHPRRRGRAPWVARDNWIGIHLAGAAVGQLEAAIADMRAQFGVCRETALAALRKYRQSPK